MYNYTKIFTYIKGSKGNFNFVSSLKEAENNNEITISSIWPFIDINNNLITNITPTQYVSLINRYFVYLRNLKFTYAGYLYQINILQENHY